MMWETSRTIAALRILRMVVFNVSYCKKRRNADQPQPKWGLDCKGCSSQINCKNITEFDEILDRVERGLK